MNDLHSLRARSSSLNPVDRALIENRRAQTTQLSPRLVSEGVIAGYIHDISIRHGNRTGEPRERRRNSEPR
jgi:hypothetical protein